MSLKMYPAYKVTNSMLLGKIPNHWQAIRLGSALNIKKDIVGDAWSKHLLLSLTLRGVIPRDMENRMGKLPADFTTYQRVVQGDLIFCLFDVEETPRTVGWVPEEGMITGAYTAAYVKPSFDSRYISYHYLSYDQRKSLRGYYAGLRNTIRSTDFSNIPIAYPPIAEQQSIVSYLDRETAEIDEFIADQEELIALLSERRTATITHAVTKGLNPDVPMKDSGVDWLGDVPEHWAVEKLSWLSRIGNGSTPATENLDYWADGNIPWLNSSCVNLDVVLEPSKLVTATALKACHLPMVPAGSILVGLTGQGKTRGMATMLGIDSTINQHIAYVTPFPALKVSYAHWFLVASYDQLRFISDGNGGTKGGLTCDQLGRIRIPQMRADEQLQIAAYLDRETAEIDAAIADAREAIALSKERRAAVISAAVTGKIDVRGLVNPEANNVEGVSVGVA